MLDPVMRRIIDPSVNALAARLPFSANQMTALGFVFGLTCFFAVAHGQFALAMVLLGLNRLADGLDGAVARARGAASDFGAYIDIVADFIFWSILPLAFTIENPASALASAVLLSSFAMSMTVFLAFATMAEKRGLETQAQGKKGFYYLAGLAEGTETILFFALCMIFPHHFALLAYGFSGLVFLSVIGRIIAAYKELVHQN